MANSRSDVQKLYRNTFGTELGKRCLESLVATFVDRPVYIPGLSFDEVAFREGERSVISKIIKTIQEEITDVN